MNKQKIGLIIFWIGIVLAIVMGGIASYSVSSAYRHLTMDQVNETIWAVPGFLFFLWAFSVPLGAILAGIGVLIYRKAKTKTVWLFGIGTFLAFMIISAIPKNKHYPPLFGIGGTLIMLFFFGILWFWTKKNHENQTVANLQLVGYVFLLIGMWFACGALSRPYQKALEGIASSPIDVMIYFVLGWLFLFLSHYKSTKLKE